MRYRSFFDLNIRPDEVEIWKTLYDFNIRTVAVNQNFDATLFAGAKKKKTEKKEDLVPPPPKIEIPEEFKGKIVALKRLTITLSDGSLLHKIVQSLNFKQYDIIAVVPVNHHTLQICCVSNEIDMISFEAQSKPQWNISRKLYNIAVQKNIYFELQYSAAISDSTSRKNTIQVAHSYYTMGKLKNIIISSGSFSKKLLRSPYDVINFSFLFGFNEKEAKKTITINSKQLLLRAEIRRRKKSILNVSRINENEIECISQKESKSTEMEVEESE